MYDHLGTELVIGDYIFGGDTCRLYTVTEDAGIDGYGMVTELGGRTPRKVYLPKFIRISKEQLTLYFMQKGYKS
jgi:hypothetical protein